MAFVYDPDILEALAGYGLAPTPETAPAVVRSALSDLYRYEIRALKQSLLAGRVRKEDYIDHVLRLRGKYWLLSLPVERWTIRE